jgi:hypothetical protein
MVTPLPAGYVYALLPSLYRTRDQEIAAELDIEPPLKSLIDVVQENLAALESNINALYDNAFIETCTLWPIPYIGDLVGVPILHQGSATTFSLRSYVANTLAFHRRKGAAVILEHVARALSGWPSLVREGIDVSALTQNLDAIIADAAACPDLRDAEAVAAVATPYSRVRRTVATTAVDVVVPGPDVVDVFVWTTKSYPVSGIEAALVKRDEAADGAGWGFTCDPLGRDLQLYNRPRSLTRITDISQAVNLPGPLPRLALYEDLNVLRRSKGLPIPPFQVMPAEFDWATAPRQSLYFADDPVVAVTVDGAPVAPENLVVADLADWPRLPQSAAGHVALDPRSGRIALPAGGAARRVMVDYCYGFAGDVGAGPYDRAGDFPTLLPPAVDWWREVAKDRSGPDISPSISDALGEWRQFVQRHGAVTGAIIVADSATYRDDLTGQAAVSAPAGSTLVLVAGRPSGGTAVPPPQPWSIDAVGLRPHIAGAVQIDGAGGEGAGTVIVDGFLIEGPVLLDAQGLADIRLGHASVAPDGGGIRDVTTMPRAAARLRVTCSITGALTLGPAIVTLDIDSCLVDGRGGAAIDAADTLLSVAGCTLMGTTTAAGLDGSDTLFCQPLTIVRRQIGRIIFSYVPGGSQTPKRYRCQPDLALLDDPTHERQVRLDLTPVFQSATFGASTYGRLSFVTDQRIMTGAGNGSEIGVFGTTLAAQRLANLRIGLADYFRTATHAVTMPLS